MAANRHVHQRPSEASRDIPYETYPYRYIDAGSAISNLPMSPPRSTGGMLRCFGCVLL